MSTFAKIQIVLAIIFAVFECVIIQLGHTATNNSPDYFAIGACGFLIYLIIVLIALGIKKIKELYEECMLMETFLIFIYHICFIAILVFIYQFVYQILIVLGVDQKTAEEWPIIVFFSIVLFCMCVGLLLSAIFENK